MLLRKEVAIALDAKKDVEGRFAKVVADADRKIKEMTAEIDGERLYDVKMRLG